MHDEWRPRRRQLRKPYTGLCGRFKRCGALLSFEGLISDERRIADYGRDCWKVPPFQSEKIAFQKI